MIRFLEQVLRKLFKARTLLNATDAQRIYFRLGPATYGNYI
jgi:hypothetical protein